MRHVAQVLLLLASLAAARAGAQADAGMGADAWESVAEFEGRDPFEHDVTEASVLLEAPGGPDPMAVLADDDPALAGPPTEDELLEPPVRVQRGAVLEAIAGVREGAHETRITLVHGLAVVEETLHFVSSARHRAEVLYRLPVAAGARLVALEVCNDTGCRSGVQDAGLGAAAYDDALAVRREGPSGLPVAHAAIDEAAPERVVVRAAPVIARGELVVRLSWVAVTPVHGGTARLSVPAAGSDARLAERALDVSAVDVVEPSLDGAPLEHATDVPPGGALELTALLPRTPEGDRLELATAPCARGTCALARAVGPRVRPTPARLVIALDVSPSTTAQARGRTIDAVRVLLGLLPSGSQVTLHAFAERSERVAGASDPTSIDLAALRASLETDLGTSTRPDRLLLALESEGALRGAHVVLVGDGGLSVAPDAAAGWTRARELGATVSSINVADRPSARTLVAEIGRTGGLSIEAGAEARRAAERHGDAPLAERLAVVLSRAGRTVELGGRPLGSLWDGEEVVLTGTLPARATLAVGDARARPRALEGALAEALAALVDGRVALVAVASADLRPEAGVCAPDGSRRGRPLAAESAVLGPGRARVALAHRRSCRGPAAEDGAAPEDGLPPRALLDQLRRRVIPVARGCFRDDRRGRAAYSTRTDIRIVLADRELTEVRVDGPITDALSACLADAFAGLDIPAFDGTLVVHWGLYTEAEPPPPTLHLAPDLSRAIDRIGVPGETTPEALLGE